MKKMREKIILYLVIVLIIASVILSVNTVASLFPNKNISEKCFMIPDTGICTNAQEKYYYDTSEGSCKKFIWGGCGGKVPFDSLNECVKSCLISTP